MAVIWMQASNQISFQRSTRWAVHHNSFHGNLTPTKVPQKVFPPTMKNIFFPFHWTFAIRPGAKYDMPHTALVCFAVCMDGVWWFLCRQFLLTCLGVVKVMGLSYMSGCFLSRGNGSTASHLENSVHVNIEWWTHLHLAYFYQLQANNFFRILAGCPGWSCFFNSMICIQSQVLDRNRKHFVSRCKCIFNSIDTSCC